MSLSLHWTSASSSTRFYALHSIQYKSESYDICGQDGKERVKVRLGCLLVPALLTSTLYILIDIKVKVLIFMVSIVKPKLRHPPSHVLHLDQNISESYDYSIPCCIFYNQLFNLICSGKYRFYKKSLHESMF